ncbi:MAG: AtpZ/AtpI family protein [Pirellulales bacterium]
MKLSGYQNHDPPEADDRAPMAQALGVATQVISAAMEMVVPGVLGYWLDTLAGTQPLFLVIGIVLGLVTGFWHLVALSRRLSAEQDARAWRERHSHEDTPPPDNLGQ